MPLPPDRTRYCSPSCGRTAHSRQKALAGVLVLARNPNPLPRCRRAHRHVRRPASSIFPLHDIGELARRLMLRSLPAAVMGRSAGRVDETLDVARTALLLALRLRLQAMPGYPAGSE